MYDKVMSTSPLNELVEASQKPDNIVNQMNRSKYLPKDVAQRLRQFCDWNYIPVIDSSEQPGTVANRQFVKENIKVIEEYTEQDELNMTKCEVLNSTMQTS